MRSVSEVVADLRGLADHNVYRQRLACEAADLLERLDADNEELRHNLALVSEALLNPKELVIDDDGVLQAVPVRPADARAAHDPSEAQHATNIINAYLTGAPHADGWHLIDNATGDLLRAIAEQCILQLRAAHDLLPDCPTCGGTGEVWEPATRLRHECQDCDHGKMSPAWVAAIARAVFADTTPAEYRQCLGQPLLAYLRSVKP